MARALSLAVALLAFQPLQASRAQVTPVQKVVQMLTKMKTQGEAAKAEETKTYEAYAEWVDDLVKDTNYDSQTLTSNIEAFTAKIASENSKAASLGDRIGELTAEITKNEGEKAESKDVCAKSAADFEAQGADYEESVDALEQAIQTLQAQSYDRPQAMMLIQKMAGKNPKLRTVYGLLQQESESRELGVPAVAAYEFQSGGIVGVLEKLFAQFKADLSDLRSREKESNHACAMKAQHLTDELAEANRVMNAKVALKSTAQVESAKAQGQLATAETDLATNKKLVTDTEAMFAAKKATFEENQIVRAQELEALGKAIEILASEKVSTSYAEHINLAQLKHVEAAAPAGLRGGAAASFLQVSREASAVERARALLKARAKTTKSKLLAKAADDAAANPFAKVITMIEDLLERLKNEAAEEATHKAFCDEELAKNKAKREAKAAEIDRLLAEIAAKEASIQEMAEEMTTLAKEQLELNEEMMKAEELRATEKAANLKAIKDSKEAQLALAQATEILRKFYDPDPTYDFVQTKQVPEMAAYKGMHSENKGITGMLEVIQSDFARLEADTTTAEKQAATEHATFMKDSKASVEEKHEREFQLSLDKDAAEFDKSELNKDLRAVEAELKAANQYYEALKPQCVTVNVSWEERIANREAELAALKEAYEILDQKAA